MKNYLKHSLYLTWIVLLILLVMSNLPPITVFGHTLRKVDILSDIRQVSYDDEEDTDSIEIALPVIKPAFVDTCRAGMTCIVDYSDSTHRGMKPFYDALTRLQNSGEPVRIAYFGDSFIEADILTADLRRMLQDKYGGCGVGYVDITSAVQGFRPTVRHSFSGWQSHAITDSLYFQRSKQGISSRYFFPSAGAYVDLKGQSKYAARLDTFDRATVYFINKGDMTLSARINKEPAVTRSFRPGAGIQQMEVDGHIGSVRFKVESVDSALFYGVALDGRSGISLDNFSVRASSGITLRYIPKKTLQEFNRVRPYDLIIMQYGLNVATRLGKNYDNYQRAMLETIEYLKESFPQASILLVSVGDRDYKTDTGDLRTMPGVKNLIRYQENMAAESRIAFWNMFEAMGGDGSMARMVHEKPSKGNYDYTHINFRGGEELAGLLFETLVYGKEQYDKRRAYEKE